MTLQTRNRCFRAGIAAAALALVFAAIAAFFAFREYPAVTQISAARSSGFIQFFLSGRTENSAYVPFATTIAAAIYSFVSISLIYYFFEKTQSPEILYIGFFVISLAFECARIIIPLKHSIALSNIYVIIGSRALIFGRCLGLFSLFAAGICSAGFEVQKQRSIAAAVISVALVIALGIPIDSLSWDSTLSMLSGYTSMFLHVEIGVAVITILSFLAAAYIRGGREYVIIGLGIFMIYLGRNLLLYSDTWITPAPGLAALSAGTWLACTQLHSVYLWM